MDLSVIICTYHRSQGLRRTLEGICRLVLKPEWQWELIVVDNNSNDDTKQVCEAFRDRLPIRYLFEPRQGKSYALNRAVAAANAPLLVFTDDDVDVDRDWIAQIVDASRRHPSATFFGGRVLPRWESDRPAWAIRHADWLLINVNVDRGDQEQVITGCTEPFFVGANFACRKTIFEKGCSFREDIGPKGGDFSGQANLRGEEIDLEERLFSLGHTAVYVPSAVVHHRHAAHRMTEKYLRHWYKGWGMAEVRRAGRMPGGRFWLGAPRFAWLHVAANGLKYAVTRFTCPSRVWLSAERKMAKNWGIICECRRMGRDASKAGQPSQ